MARSVCQSLCEDGDVPSVCLYLALGQVNMQSRLCLCEFSLCLCVCVSSAFVLRAGRSLERARGGGPLLQMRVGFFCNCDFMCVCVCVCVCVCLCV
jgi:hypothetical protein